MSPQTAKDENHRACAECKGRKIRCQRSREDLDCCQRCFRLGQECILPVPQRRKRTTRLRHRVDQLEQSHGAILAMLSTTQTPTSSETANATHLTPQSVTTSLESDAACNPRPTAQHGHRGFFAEGLISLEEAENLLSCYRLMSQHHFPYVLLPEDISVSQFYSERPILLQAVFTVASWKNRSLQLILEEQLVKDLGVRFFEGEKSLDIVQGLLVYLAWYHFFTKQTSQQAYRFVSLAVTVMIELGLNRRPRAIITQHEMIVGLPPGSVVPTNNIPSTKFWSHEERRAFIGTYVLSIFSSLLYRKQSPLMYTEYLQDCALSLCEDNCVPSDLTLIHYVRLLRIASDVYTAFNHADKDNEREMSDDHVRSLVKALERQLAEWRSSLPITVSEDVRLRSSSHLVDAYIHEVGLYSALQGQLLSVTRIEILYDCLNCVQNYVGTILPLSVEQIQGWAGVNWRQLHYVTMLANKIVLTIDSTATSEESIMRIAKLDGFLEQLSAKTRHLYSMTNTPLGQTHYFQQLSVEWQTIRNWYRATRDGAVGLGFQAQGSRPQDGPVPRNQAYHQGMDINQVQDLNWTIFGGTENWADISF